MWIGIVTGMAAEARAARRLGAVRVACSGADSLRALDAARMLADQGAGALLSFGIAGGLAPQVRPGTVIVGNAVARPGLETLHADTVWSEALAAGLGARQVPVYGSWETIGWATDKHMAHRLTGAEAVDVESVAVAVVATERGLPFAILRAIADPARRTLPSSALAGVKPDGSTAPLAVMKALAGRPAELPGLLRLALEAKAGLDGLVRGVGLLNGDLRLVAEPGHRLRHVV